MKWVLLKFSGCSELLTDFERIGDHILNIAQAYSDGIQYSCAFIINQIWGYVDSTSTKKLQVNMSNLRPKLGSNPDENKYIINELSVGYRMQDEL